MALSAAIAISTAGVISNYFKNSPGTFLVIICIFVIVVSIMSAVLSYLFMNYVYDLQWHESKIVRAWLKDKDGRDFVEEMHNQSRSPYADKAEGISFTKDGIVDLVTNIYFSINIISAIIAFLLIIVISVRSF